MSFLEPKTENPCTKFIEYKSDTGSLQYYDKEKKEQVVISQPFRFIVLEELSTITGYSDTHQCGIYSNEIHYLQEEKLTVKSFKGGLKIVGYYDEIKGDIIAEGGKFAKSVYAMMIKEDDTLELINIKFKGASVSAWFEKTFNPDRKIIEINGSVDKKKGKVDYKEPVFQCSAMDKKYFEPCKEGAILVRDYLKQYKNKPEVTSNGHAETHSAETNGQKKDDDLPF